MTDSLELWGGIECTLNRVDDTFFDQLTVSGHRDRVDADLELFASLGLRTLRTAVHWEHVESTQSWDYPDNLIAAAARVGIRPIVGLVHHGSGPTHTHLLDPDFPEGLAAFALQVATRYPDVLDYTPVNEPQTTGRFAALYGHWYPHQRSMHLYVRALYNQIKATALAMQAIRTVQPEARLIHTEDAGATFSTPELEDFRIEREHRRWLGVDLLCGCVTSRHPLFSFLREHGLSESEILWFAHNPCPPNILGLNYYVTSDRFLDHRLDLYPPHLAGGDTGSEPLVDFEAVRVHRPGISGVGRILRQAWERYGIPVALTEAHLGCDPDQQVRWLAEAWNEARAARADGVDVRAITAWALLGSYNWWNLCTRNTGIYEPGVFNLLPGEPTPTPLTSLVARLAERRDPGPRESAPGWWRLDSRLNKPAHDDPRSWSKAS